MKVKLKCKYGEHLPGAIVDIKDKKVADALIEAGNAVTPGADATDGGGLKELQAENARLQGDLQVAGAQIEALTEKLKGYEDGAKGNAK